jgi:hypothetical protein
MNSRRTMLLLILVMAFTASGCAITHKVKLAPQLDGLEVYPKASVSVGAYYSSQFANFELKRASGTGYMAASVGEASVKMFEGILPMAFEQAVPVTSLPPYDPARDDIIAVIEPSIEDFDFWIAFEKVAENQAITYRLTVRNLEGVPVSSWTVRGKGVPPKGNRRPLVNLDIEDAANKILRQLHEKFNDEEFLALLTNTPNEGPAASATASKGEDFIIVEADVFNDQEKQKELFGYDLQNRGVTVIRVSIHNRHDSRSLLVRPSDIRLKLSEDRSYNPECAIKVASMLETTTGANVALAFFGPLAAMGGAGITNTKIRTEGKEKFQSLALAESVLSAGDSYDGYLYFLLPAENDSSLDNAILSLWLVEEGTSMGERVELPLTANPASQ